MAQFSERDFIELRRNRIGVVFQSFALLPLLSAYENVELPMRIAGLSARERSERTNDALEMVALSRRARHRPYELSGGEQQRVSIARAIAMRPDIVLADEPTGELDSNNASAIFGPLQRNGNRPRHVSSSHYPRPHPPRHGRPHLHHARRRDATHRGSTELKPIKVSPRLHP